MSGQNTWNFLPGDMGPFGLVTNSDGALYHFAGAVSFTRDSNADRVTQFAYSGSVTDVCAALS